MCVILVPLTLIGWRDYARLASVGTSIALQVRSVVGFGLSGPHRISLSVFPRETLQVSTSQVSKRPQGKTSDRVQLTFNKSPDLFNNKAGITLAIQMHIMKTSKRILTNLMFAVSDGDNPTHLRFMPHTRHVGAETIQIEKIRKS